MFDKGYPFRKYKTPCGANEFPIIEKFIYRFKTVKNRTYLVHVEKYDFHVYVLKFHDKNHSNSADRFSFILDDFDCGSVLKTVIDVAMSILRENEYASFAFVGVHKITAKKKIETKETAGTQRFRVYKRVAEYFLGGKTFLHVYEQRSNCYLLVNKMHPNPEAIHEEILDMFASRYQELSHL